MVGGGFWSGDGGIFDIPGLDKDPFAGERAPDWPQPVPAPPLDPAKTAPEYAKTIDPREFLDWKPKPPPPAEDPQVMIDRIVYESQPDFIGPKSYMTWFYWNYEQAFAEMEAQVAEMIDNMGPAFTDDNGNPVTPSVEEHREARRLVKEVGDTMRAQVAKSKAAFIGPTR
tara:strand:- start:210 stop:719 length:510 start_codon:yes stop_codon:yes gene_type:complete